MAAPHCPHTTRSAKPVSAAPCSANTGLPTGGSSGRALARHPCQCPTKQSPQDPYPKPLKPPTVHLYRAMREKGGTWTGWGQSAIKSELRSSSGCVWEVIIGRKNIMYKVKRILYLTTDVMKQMVDSIGAYSCNFSLVHICKYQENGVRSKCILNILIFWSWVIKKQKKL